MTKKKKKKCSLGRQRYVCECVVNSMAGWEILKLFCADRLCPVL